MELRPGFDVAFEKLVEVAAAAAARSANSNADQNIPEEIKWRDAEIAMNDAVSMRPAAHTDIHAWGERRRGRESICAAHAWHMRTHRRRRANRHSW